MNELCLLHRKTIVVDSMGQRKSELTDREVFCDSRSKPVGSKEFYESGRVGIKAVLCLLVHLDEYEKEELLTFDGERYKIYRTYPRRDELVELYCERAIDEK